MHGVNSLLVGELPREGEVSLTLELLWELGHHEPRYLYFLASVGFSDFLEYKQMLLDLYGDVRAAYS